MPSADFRISQQSLAHRALENLQANLERLGNLQDEASSLKRLRKPSDSPIDAVTALRLRADLGRNDQISRNVEDALGWLGTADDTLSTSIEQLQRVRDLVIQARNASADQTARDGIATELDKLRESLLGLANARYTGRAVFAGTASGDAAYTADGAYVGVSSAIERAIAPGVRVQVNVNGDEVFGVPGNDLFTALAQLSNAVRSNPGGLDTLAPDLDARIAQVQSRQAEIGARFRRVEAMQNRNSADALTMKKNLATVEDADLAETMMDLRTQEIAYQAALQATARAIQPSLADFLR